MRKCSVISKSLERSPSTGPEWIVWHRIHFHHSLEQGTWMAEKTLLQETGLPRSTLHRAAQVIDERKAAPAGERP